MSSYDDDRVIALLRDAVPPVPEAADRVVAIRSRAGRQRTVLWTQTLGAVASVLLVVGMAAAVSGPGGGDDLRPLDEPVAALADALTREKSVRFEASMTPIDPVAEAEFIASHATGAATRDGDVLLKGDLSFASLLGDDPREEREVRYVDGVTYVSVTARDNVPAGKKWLRTGEDAPSGGVAVITEMLRNVDSLATDVRHLRTTTVRGEPVEEYRLTIPARYAAGQAVDVTFALDAESRLRRAAAEFSWQRVIGYGGSIEYDESVATARAVPPVAVATPRVGMSPSDGPQPTKVWLNPTAGPSYEVMPPIPTPRPDDDPLNVRVEIELFGYGDDVAIVAPPASEVIAEDDFRPGGNDELADVFEMCVEQAKDAAEAEQCREMFEGVAETSTGTYGSAESPPPGAVTLMPEVTASASPAP